MGSLTDGLKSGDISFGELRAWDSPIRKWRAQVYKIDSRGSRHVKTTTVSARDVIDVLRKLHLPYTRSRWAVWEIDDEGLYAEMERGWAVEIELLQR